MARQTNVYSIRVKYVPAWMPGAGFRRLATQWRKSSYSTVEAAFSYAKDQVVCSDIY